MGKQRVDERLLLRVAENARLNLTKEEIKRFLPQLQEILDAFSKLDELKIEKEQPSFQPIKLSNVSRQDQVEKCLTQDEALLNAKHKKDGYIMGPKVT